MLYIVTLPKLQLFLQMKLLTRHLYQSTTPLCLDREATATASHRARQDLLTSSPATTPLARLAPSRAPLPPLPPPLSPSPARPPRNPAASPDCWSTPKSFPPPPTPMKRITLFRNLSHPAAYQRKFRKSLWK